MATEATNPELSNARRQQVYTGIYHFAGGTEFEELVAQEAGPVEDIIKKCNELGQKLGKPVIFLGDGVPVYKDIIEELCNVEHSYAPAHLSRQRAGAVAIRAMKLYEEGKAEPASDHAPIYLRKSQAERELEAKGKNNSLRYETSLLNLLQTTEQKNILSSEVLSFHSLLRSLGKFSFF